mmetsp:Transcript_137387/g.342674  ORF Transcript_137387/g.342674 Transcript_137387/m.342674 type:complete len:332 (-) Transcript_137387:89-1084(-)
MSAAKYEPDSGSEQDKPPKVSAEAGRRCVRMIQHYPVLSQEWMGLIDSLKQLTRLVHLESGMPVDARVNEACGRDQESGGTLWDQESHENAVRILVEEAKVNLCLRMMCDFKTWQYNLDQRKADVEQAAQSMNVTEEHIEAKCKQFEESLGVLLWRSFLHVETLQLMDVPMLIEHTAKVLSYCDRVQREKLQRSRNQQEMLAVAYFAALMKHAEALNNAEVLAKSRECRLVRLATCHVINHAATEYPSQISVEVAHGFAALAYNEDFRTDWTIFFEDDSGNLDTEFCYYFLQLRDLVEKVISEFGEKKAELRPLTDFFHVIERKVGAGPPP